MVILGWHSHSGVHMIAAPPVILMSALILDYLLPDEPSHLFSHSIFYITATTSLVFYVSISYIDEIQDSAAVTAAKIFAWPAGLVAEIFFEHLYYYILSIGAGNRGLGLYGSYRKQVYLGAKTVLRAPVDLYIYIKEGLLLEIEMNKAREANGPSASTGPLLDNVEMEGKASLSHLPSYSVCLDYPILTITIICLL